MSISNFVVFAPAQGFQAFSINENGISVNIDDKMALSSSIVELKQGSELVKCGFLMSNNGMFSFRITIYKQIFELMGSRLGHSCGISMEFIEDIPPVSNVVNILRDSLDGMLRVCLRGENHFCNLIDFSDFCVRLQKEFKEYVIPLFGGLPKNSLTYPIIGDVGGCSIALNKIDMSNRNDLASLIFKIIKSFTYLLADEIYIQDGDSEIVDKNIIVYDSIDTVLTQSFDLICNRIINTVENNEKLKIIVDEANRLKTLNKELEAKIKNNDEEVLVLKNENSALLNRLNSIDLQNTGHKILLDPVRVIGDNSFKCNSSDLRLDFKRSTDKIFIQLNSFLVEIKKIGQLIIIFSLIIMIFVFINPFIQNHVFKKNEATVDTKKNEIVQPAASS